MKIRVAILGLVILLIGAACVHNSVQKVKASEKKQLLRVGVYDSRGIAIAYLGSEHWNKILKEKQAELEQARKDGDTERVKEIEAWGPAHQQHAHLQGFGTAPVHEYLQVVKDQIPAVAQKAGVDVIVSKWETDYLAADADVVDVTMELAKLFNPNEKAYKSIESLDKWKPYGEEELKNLKD